MEWPFRRFVKAFDAFQRRALCDEWKQRKALHLAALSANTNLDSEGNDRPAIMKQVEESYDSIIVGIWNGTSGEVNEAEETEWTSDFMKAGRKAKGAITAPLLPGETVISELA